MNVLDFQQNPVILMTKHSFNIVYTNPARQARPRHSATSEMARMIENVPSRAHSPRRLTLKPANG
jgi:nitrogen-specific signal transduction histidine kinase